MNHLYRYIAIRWGMSLVIGYFVGVHFARYGIPLWAIVTYGFCLTTIIEALYLLKQLTR